jgi:hypothetical protein
MKHILIRHCYQNKSFEERATKLAESINKEIGMKANLMIGHVGEFSVWVDDKPIARKTVFGFPSESKVIKDLKKELGMK